MGVLSNITINKLIFCSALWSLSGTIFLFTCASPIVRAFINDVETVHYGQLFQRIICITGPCISVTMLTITTFQSVGKKVQPLVLSLLRKGGVDIPFMLLLNQLVGINGIVFGFYCNASRHFAVCSILAQSIHSSWIVITFWTGKQYDVIILITLEMLVHNCIQLCGNLRKIPV